MVDVVEIPPPAQRRLLLTFIEPEIESRYRQYMRQSVESFYLVGIYCTLVTAIIWFVQFSEMKLLAKMFLWTTVLYDLTCIYLHKKSVNYFRKYGFLMTLPTILAGCGFCGAWSSIAGNQFAIPGTIYFQFFIVLHGLPWFLSIASVSSMLFTFWYCVPAVVVGCEPDERMFNQIAGSISMTFLVAFALDASYRHHFSSLHVIGKYAELLSSKTEPSSDGSGTAAELQILKKTLNTVQSVNEALLRKTEEVERAMLAKEQFMATMSHEIRSPLHSIIALSSLLLEAKSLNEEEQSMINTVYTSSEHLMTVVNDILDYTRIQAHKMELVPENFHLQSFVEGVLGIVGPLIRTGVDLVSTVNTLEDIEVIGDAARLKQICCNLLSNAAKFTHKGSVGLHVEVGGRSDKVAVGQDVLLLRIRVADSGIGMSEDYKTRMYTPFEQSDKTISRQYGGTGLGLVITKQLVDMFGGILECETRVGFGTTFCVTLPLRFAPRCQNSSFSSLSGTSTLSSLSLDHSSSPVSLPCSVAENDDISPRGRGPSSQGLHEASDPGGACYSTAAVAVGSSLPLRKCVFVVDSSLSLAVIECAKKWLYLGGAQRVLTELEFLSEESATRDSNDDLQEEQAEQEAQVGGLRYRRTTRVTGGDKRGASEGADETISAGSSCVASGDTSFGASSDGGGSVGCSREIKVVVPGLSDEHETSKVCRSQQSVIVCVCKHGQEEAMLRSVGQLDSTGKVIVLEKGRAAQAAAALRATAVAFTQGTRIKGMDLWMKSDSPRAFSASSRDLLSSDVSSSPRGKTQINNSHSHHPHHGHHHLQQQQQHQQQQQDKKVLWARAVCELLPLTGRNLLRAAMEIVSASDDQPLNPATDNNDARTACRETHESSSSFPSSNASGLGETPSLISPHSHYTRARMPSIALTSGPVVFSALRVLLVDDNAVNRKVGTQLLQRCGVVKVESAENGLQAIDAIARSIDGLGSDATRRIDVVLMDMHMPVMDGIAAAKEILRRWPDVKERPVVVACTADVFAISDDSFFLVHHKAIQLCAARRSA